MLQTNTRIKVLTKKKPLKVCVGRQSWSGRTGARRGDFKVPPAAAASPLLVASAPSSAASGGRAGRLRFCPPPHGKHERQRLPPARKYRKRDWEIRSCCNCMEWWHTMSPLTNSKYKYLSFSGLITCLGDMQSLISWHCDQLFYSCRSVRIFCVGRRRQRRTCLSIESAAPHTTDQGCHTHKLCHQTFWLNIFFRHFVCCEGYEVKTFKMHCSWQPCNSRPLLPPSSPFLSMSSCPWSRKIGRRLRSRPAPLSSDRHPGRRSR